MLRPFLRGKKDLLVGVLGIALTTIWKGGSHAYSARSTVQPAEVPGDLTLGGMVGVLGLHPRPVAAEPPPETATVRLIDQIGALCLAPQFIAGELLQSEGFTDVQYTQVKPGASIYEVLASGGADISMAFGAPVLLRIDTGKPLVLLSGLHVGCLEPFGNERVRTIRDLKGKTVIIPGLGSANHIFLASMAAYVGLDPNKEINWVTDLAVRPPAEWARLLAEGQFDAIMVAPPRSLAFREQGVGHVVVNMTTDRPWSQYFALHGRGPPGLCPAAPRGHQAGAARPLESRHLCALEPGPAARYLLDKGYTKQFDYLLDKSDTTHTTLPSRPSRKSPTPGGASMTPRTPCASSPCASTRSA